FYILEGVMHIFLNKKWHKCVQGTYIIIPGHTPHDFENRHNKKSGILSFNNKSGFENQMPEIQKWFAENPPEDIL
ncbi:cupin domain-containing protein, partial [bacterium]|nr:cupin domain-containing protein [bacterium]